MMRQSLYFNARPQQIEHTQRLHKPMDDVYIVSRTLDVSLILLQDGASLDISGMIVMPWLE